MNSRKMTLKLKKKTKNPRKQQPYAFIRDAKLNFSRPRLRLAVLSNIKMGREDGSLEIRGD
jgi:hypothetical protein